jgi:hypothetical protein
VLTGKGVLVHKSQKRTFMSPEAEASLVPSGLKETAKMLSVCPERVEAQRVAGLTR